MTDPAPARGRPRPARNPPADEEYARAYAAGFEEGIRSALREILLHSSRGHTAQELRMLAESRLARLSEEVDLKRRSLLAPPRRPAWGALLRPPPNPSARAWVAPVRGTPPVAAIAAGSSVIVREERPLRALELLRANAPAFPRVVVVSLHPPEIPGIASRPTDRHRPPNGRPRGRRRGRPSSVGARRAPSRADRSVGGALVYVDSLEYFLSEDGPETTVRFAHWLVGQAKSTGSAILVSYDSRSLDIKDASRLERAFPQVL